MTLPLPRFGNFVVITNVAPIALTAYWPAAAHRSRTKHVFHAPPQPPENEEAIREQRTASTYASEVTTGSDLRLDLFRGIALWLIFLDHIPSNLVAWITIRNYGFSDATEIFVFISGYTAAFVYGREMDNRGFVVAGARILRRAWQVYVAHIFLFVLYMTEMAYVSTTFENPLFNEEMDILNFLKQPSTLVQALLLRFQPPNLDVLPLYIVLLATFPPVLWLLRRSPTLALGASAALYGLTWQFDWKFATYPDGAWFFNPLAWQLIFTFGAWCALGGAARLARLIHSW